MWASISTTIYIECIGFFRLRLLILDPDGIRELISKYEEYTQGIKSNALTLAWYMRGGASYEDILNMSQVERKSINKLVEEHLETTKKTQLPFF